MREVGENSPFAGELRVGIDTLLRFRPRPGDHDVNLPSVEVFLDRHVQSADFAEPTVKLNNGEFDAAGYVVDLEGKGERQLAGERQHPTPFADGFDHPLRHVNLARVHGAANLHRRQKPLPQWAHQAGCGDDRPGRTPPLPIIRTHQRIVELDARGLVGEDIVRAVDIRGLLGSSLRPAIRVVPPLERLPRPF